MTEIQVYDGTGVLPGYERFEDWSDAYVIISTNNGRTGEQTIFSGKLEFHGHNDDGRDRITIGTNDEGYSLYNIFSQEHSKPEIQQGNMVLKIKQGPELIVFGDCVVAAVCTRREDKFGRIIIPIEINFGWKRNE